MRIAAILWMALASVIASPPPVEDAVSPRFVVLVHDPSSGASAGLAVRGGDPAAPSATLHTRERAVWATVEGEGPLPAETGPTLGRAQGDDASRRALVGEIGHTPRPRLRWALWSGPEGTATFQGVRADEALVDLGPRVVVWGRGLPRKLVRGLARRLRVAPNDPVEALLDLAAELDDVWPDHAPKIVELVAVGPARAREHLGPIATPTSSRTLVDRHLHHLAWVEVAFQLEAARRDCTEHAELGCRAAVNALMRAGHRALTRFPEHPVLLEALAEADELASPPGASARPSP